jgi:hypothetical protein
MIGVSAWMSLSRKRYNVITRFDSAIGDTNKIHVSNLTLRCSWAVSYVELKCLLRVPPMGFGPKAGSLLISLV